MMKKLKELDLRLRATRDSATLMGAKGFIKYYEIYRKYSSLFLLCGLLWFVGTGQWLLAYLIFVGLHLHVLFNQMWWKLKTIEYHYDLVMENGTEYEMGAVQETESEQEN